MRFSSNYACLLSPYAFLCARRPPRSISAVLFGQRCRDCFWYVTCTDPIFNSVCKGIIDQLQRYIAPSATGSSKEQFSQSVFYRQPGGQQLLQYYSTAVSRWFLTLSSFVVPYPVTPRTLQCIIILRKAALYHYCLLYTSPSPRD